MGLAPPYRILDSLVGSSDEQVVDNKTSTTPVPLTFINVSMRQCA